MNAYAPTPRTRVKRLPKRGHYDRATVHAILDAGFVAHIGYLIDGQPYVTPTSYWREGDHVYWHGFQRQPHAASPSARGGARLPHRHACRRASAGSLGLPPFDELSLSHGTRHGRTGQRPGREAAALEAFVERLYPGRWSELRPVTSQELKATTVLRMTLDEVSAKIRTGPPVEDEEDYGLPCWAGVVPLASVRGRPEPDPRLPEIPLPGYLAAHPRLQPRDHPPLIDGG